ncbi:adenylyl cyclase associated protein [Babesia ovata]|uniref:Adenylyl cyclase associated protein n=1 Tax=Babesia ovata TaxID=189622 RepID=A0A2H6KE15_9APIC|nr:adenylyl cyclase associated protein [Babesia ovata]GBE61238.1 adenylyl cyclase associated protein [Babesia ovata]
MAEDSMRAEPTFELLGDVWTIANQRGTTLDLSRATRTQSVQVCECDGLKLIIPDKIVSLSIVSCSNVEVDMHSSISGLELTDCHGVKIRVKSSLPSAAIDKCQQVGFWITSANAEYIMFTSCKSGDMNVNVNRNTSGNVDEDDWVERPIPEQFESRFNAKLQLDTKPSMLY